MPSKFLSTREVADMTGRTIHQVRNWIYEDKIKADFFLGQWRIYRNEFLDTIRNDMRGKKK